MSSPSYALPLRLERRSSRYLLTALVGVHGLALLVIPPLPVAWWIKVPVALAIAAQWFVTWRRQLALTSPLAVKGLVWTGENTWELFGADGASRKAKLLPGAYIHPLLVILRFLTEDKHKCAVVLPRDSLDPDSHRRLRVRLLQGKATAED
jgi:hypothetical protein